MSKRSEEAALKAYPAARGHMHDRPYQREGFINGYEQAEKDTIAKIRKQVEAWMLDNQEGDEYITGERVAFRSVLHLLKEMEEEKC